MESVALGWWDPSAVFPDLRPVHPLSIWLIVQTSSNLTLKLRESFNPNEVSPVKIIITEGYLEEYSQMVKNGSLKAQSVNYAR